MEGATKTQYVQRNEIVFYSVHLNSISYFNKHSRLLKHIYAVVIVKAIADTNEIWVDSFPKTT